MTGRGGGSKRDSRCAVSAHGSVIEHRHLPESKGVPGSRLVRCTRQTREAGQATARLPHLPGRATAKGE